ncbi:MAG: type II toxin-antitoxin system PemK/MazF family toxin [Roseiarcus sp.]
MDRRGRRRGGLGRVKRGDIVIASPPGDYGKPRPAVILQADGFALASLTIAPLTSELRDALSRQSS